MHHETQSLTGLILDSNLINFVIASALLGYFIFKFVPKSASDRKLQLEQDIANAMAAKRDAEAKLQELNSAIQAAKEEAKSIVDSAKDSAELLKSSILAETKQQIIRMQDNAELEIEQQKSIALDKLRKQVAQSVCEQAEAYIAKNAEEFNQVFSTKMKQNIEELKSLV